MGKTPPQLSLDLIFDEGAHGAVVKGLVWRPTGKLGGKEEIAGLWDDGTGDAWWLFDTEGGKTQLATPADFGVENASDVKELRFSPEGDRVIVVLAESFLLFDVEARRALTLGLEGEGDSCSIRGKDPKLSADGQRLAFVRDEDLYVLELASEASQRRLTEDGKSGVLLNGITDWVYWEELWLRSATGHWWSPDGSRLAYYRFDDSEVPVHPILDTRPLHPKVTQQRYPKTGDPVPRVEVRVVDLESGATVTLETADGDKDIYLPRVHWHPDGERVAVERLRRDQKRLDLLLCHVRDGASRLLARQERPTWIDLGCFSFLRDGRFLWSTEETGWRQLYLYDGNGDRRRRLTPDGLALVSLDKVNEKGGFFVMTGHSTAVLGAAERHLYRGRLDADKPAVDRVSDAPGWHQGTVSASGAWVDEANDAGQPTTQTIRHLERSRETALPRRPPSYDLSRLPRWQHLAIPGPHGLELPAQMLPPADFDPARRYPVIMYHYGGPSSQVVQRRGILGHLTLLWHTMMAERGYGVFMVDNEGSAFFGQDGADKLHRRFGEVELRGQLAGVDYLKTLPWVDPERLGLWGWSGGGSNTLYCLFRKPGVWKAGIAGAPATDWRCYDAIWTERYLDHPEDNAEGYRASSPLTYAENLRDALLLVHGTTDDNVHFQNTVNLAEKLTEEGLPFELGIYPNAGHSFLGFTKNARRHFFARIMSFFDRHLLAGGERSGTET